MARAKSALYVGLGGHIVAIDTATGEELWRTKLKRGANDATVYQDGQYVYGAASGEVFCLDPATGDVRWNAKLKGLGTGLVAFPGSDGAVIEAARARAAAAAAAAAT